MSIKQGTHDVTMGGALSKDDLLEIVQTEIDNLSTKSKGNEGITGKDDLKPLVKAIQDAREAGLGSDGLIKKGIDFQMKMTNQLVIQTEVKSALGSRNYDHMKSAVERGKGIQLNTKQFKTLQAEFLIFQQEVLKKMKEDNEGFRRKAEGDATTPITSEQGERSPEKTLEKNSSTSSSKRFFFRPKKANQTSRNGSPSTPTETASEPDEVNNGGEEEESDKNGPPKKKGPILKNVLRPLSSFRKPGSRESGTPTPPSSPSDDFQLQDRPLPSANVLASVGSISELESAAQYDSLVEAMQRVKLVIDGTSENRSIGPGAILAAAGNDLDLVTGDPTTVHLFVGHWHGVVKSSNQANLGLKTITVGEIDSKVSPGKWEIRMTKPTENGNNAGVQAINGDVIKKYTNEIDGLKRQLSVMEDELRSAKEIKSVREAAPVVKALVGERSESLAIEAKLEEEKVKEEERLVAKENEARLALPSFSEVDDSIPGMQGSPRMTANHNSNEDMSDIPLDMMSMKELREYIQSKGGNIEGLKTKEELLERAMNLKGDTASKSKDLLPPPIPSIPVKKAVPEGDGPKLKDDEKYSKYFKMLTVGLPKDAVKHKMTKDGLDPSVIDMDPETPVSALTSDGGKLKDHPKYGKYFKMLKVGLTAEAVKHKMTQDGLDPSVLDFDPEGPANVVPPDELIPYLKMLQFGVPRPVVEYKMRTHNLDPALLDQFGAPQDIPRLDIKVGEDPRFIPFFKMLAVGVPRDAVKLKMKQKGFDPAILDMDPNEFSPVDGSNITPPKRGGGANKKKKDDGYQWKKIYWQPVTVPKVQEIKTIWTRDLGFDLIDAERNELRQLFSIKVGTPENEEAKVDKKKEEEKSLQILESARAQNVSILLQRFKMVTLQDLKRMISNMKISDGFELSADDMKSILSMLPTPEEAEKLRANADKIDQYGQAEKHFLGLMDIPRFRNRIACFLFKLQFKELKGDVEFDIQALQDGVSHLMESQKLARLLSIILSTGNMLNSHGGFHTQEDGYVPVSGFKLSSLAKLRLTKGHGSHKTALNFVVSVLHERQRQVLDYIIAETDPIRAAASVVLSNAKAQVKSLAVGVKELENEVNHAESIKSDPEASKNITKEDETFFAAVEAFFQKARRDVHDLSTGIAKAEKDFISLVTYFQEDAETTPEVLFKTLVTFFDDCNAALQENNVARAKAVRRKMEGEDDAPAEDSI